MNKEQQSEYVLNQNMYNIKLCKHQHYVMVEVEEEVDGEMKTVVKIINNGCTNLRRDGSAYCQECSDKHNNKVTS